MGHVHGKLLFPKDKRKVTKIYIKEKRKRVILE